MKNSIDIAEALIVSRIIYTQKAKVWHALTRAAGIQKWWGPKNFSAPFCMLDFRVAGAYRFCMRSSAGQHFWSKGIYIKIDPLNEFVMTDCFADEKGNTVPASYYDMPGDWPEELLISISLQELQGRTRVTLRHEGIPAGEMQDVCRDGWQESLDKLARSLE